MVTTKVKRVKGNHDIVSLSGEELGTERIEMICNWCNCNLVQISDRTGNNKEWFCRKCGIAYPDPKEIRRKHKVTMEDYDHEPAVTTTPDPVSLFEHRELEIRGGLLNLKEKV